MKFPNNSVCLYLTLLLFSALIQQPVTATQAAWYKLADPDGNFTVEFPSSPSYEEVSVPSTGERLQTYNLAYGNNYLSFNYTDLPLASATAKAPVATRLEVYVRDYTKTIIDAGGQVLLRTLLLDGGMEFISKYPTGKAREMSYEQLRVYFRDARRYILSCTSLSTGGINQSVARRFFSSLQLYRMQMPGGAYKDVRKVDSNSPPQNPANAAWYRFTSLAGDFEAEFPDKPDYNTKAHPITGTQVECVSFTYGEYDFSVQSSELVPALATPAEWELWFASATEKFLRGSKSSLIRQTRLADGALQIDSRRQLDGRTMFIRARVYARNSRGYVVSGSVFGQSLAALDKPLPARFFTSFRLR